MEEEAVTEMVEEIEVVPIIEVVREGGLVEAARVVLEMEVNKRTFLK